MDRQVEAALGALLHDIGRIVVRTGEKVQEGKGGYCFLKEEVGIENKEILESVLIPWGKRLGSTSDDSLGYLVSAADKIASSGGSGEEAKELKDMLAPQESIFNYLNSNQARCFLAPSIDIDHSRMYPNQEKLYFTTSQYKTLKKELAVELKVDSWDNRRLACLLDFWEEKLSGIPACTGSGVGADISLYDHTRFTAAIAVCLYIYLENQGISSMKEAAWKNFKSLCTMDVFLLFSMDVSGIQSFLYSIDSKGALKTLRARSFYLEIMMEHLVDEILECTGLSRVNLLYSGGGHCYLLLPNTKFIKQQLSKKIEEINEWFIGIFQTDLYVSAGWQECSANDIQNIPGGSYKKLFRGVSKAISEKKRSRYTARQIQTLNQVDQGDGERECRICKRSGILNEKHECSLCESFLRTANDILSKDYFCVAKEKGTMSLPLPGGKYLNVDSESGFKEKKTSGQIVRAYCKNKRDYKFRYATKLWAAAYSSNKTFEEFAAAAEGVDRIGIFRGDVDNLGMTFVAGFDKETEGHGSVTLARNAVLSRRLSWFFKYYINQVMEGEELAIVYSGGDDVFIAGAWDAVTKASVKLHEALDSYSQSTLTISGGVGIYTPGYPLNIMAQETARLEEAAKKYRGSVKNAVSLFHTDFVFQWKDFISHVQGEKYQAIRQFFTGDTERGRSFLYQILQLIQESGEQINFARYVYLLARMEPDKNCRDEVRRQYREFSGKLYSWIAAGDDEVRKQLMAAIYLYIYETRESEARED